MWSHKWLKWKTAVKKAYQLIKNNNNNKNELLQRKVDFFSFKKHLTKPPKKNAPHQPPYLQPSIQLNQNKSRNQTPKTQISFTLHQH